MTRDVKIFPAVLNGVVRAIPSKSQAHRALICAALADKQTIIECEGGSDDIAATADCLSALGAKIEREAGVYVVHPLKREADGDAVTLPCGESGSTFRFMLPIAGALGRKASFDLKGRLPQRPLSPLYEELVRHGAELSPQGSVPFYCEGHLAPGRYSLDAGVSSQFISGLLFALPLLDGDSELQLTGQAESFPYIELTLAMLEIFGIKTEFKNNIFSIPGGQTFRSPGKARVEGDWSNAAFWMSAGAVGKGSITCAGLNLQSRQGDRAILDVLAKFGARIKTEDSAVTVSGGKLRGIEIDARDIPDLVPVLAVVAAVAKGTTVIRNAARLRTKESDRLAAVSAVLRALGADVNETEDGLVIRGGAALTGACVSSCGDHRIAMSAAIAAAVCGQPVVIQGAQAVNKSYPGFFDDLRSLGGGVQDLNT
ncbi:MAG: 3-phosphoshikimate 1-carboxyvinyltransferase [Treponema sp.]|jgi:3-phosphoshikimate 1-carboxyvinyltransferase|nr:3-phosphoshikimate 1-carboxyvinyltransferase [Treponema sp.]